MFDVIVIGGGASGLVSSIMASRNGVSVCVLERNKSCGKKILVTGNGRCNYYNSDQNIRHYHSRNYNLLGKIINDNNILLPLLVVKNLGENAAIAIIKEREKNGLYKDFFEFVARTYDKGINKLILESLINAGALDCFKESKKTLRENILLAINYASLIADLDESLVMKPQLEKHQEDDDEILRQNEYNTLGFYLTSHPASKYQNSSIIKSDKITNYFDKNINVLGLIEKISNIKTKKNEDMCFITLSDEYGNMNLTVFPKQMMLVVNLKKGDLIVVTGKVTKRYAEYSILVYQIKKV